MKTMTIIDFQISHRRVEGACWAAFFCQAQDWPVIGWIQIFKTGL
jgi:hypothetical protein